MKQQSAEQQSFEVVLESEEEGGYHILCPTLKGCHSYGTTKGEALENIKEAIELWLESAKELGIKLAGAATQKRRGGALYG